jgi:DNA mismatch endonuclease (patch repair protein)
LERNKTRDAEVRKMLRGLGWSVLTVWECQLKRLPQLTERIRRFLER